MAVLAQQPLDLGNRVGRRWVALEGQTTDGGTQTESLTCFARSDWECHARSSEELGSNGDKYKPLDSASISGAPTFTFAYCDGCFAHSVNPSNLAAACSFAWTPSSCWFSGPILPILPLSASDLISWSSATTWASADRYCR